MVKQCVDERGWQHLRVVDDRGVPIPGQKHVEMSTDTTSEGSGVRRGRVRVTFEVGPEGVEM